MTRRLNPIWDNEELLKEAARTCKSATEMLTFLGLNHNGGNYGTLSGRAQIYGFVIPRFTGHDQTAAARKGNRYTVEELFSDRGIRAHGHTLKKNLIEHFGYEDICSECGQLPEWNGKPLVLEVDHIDGNKFNHTVENLRILCGHCHSQTETFRGRNKDKKIYSYCPCGARISLASKQCRQCLTKTNREDFLRNCPYPPLDALYTLYLKDGTMENLAKRYGKSSNALRKYIRSFGVTLDDFKQGTVV